MKCVSTFQFDISHGLNVRINCVLQIWWFMVSWFVSISYNWFRWHLSMHLFQCDVIIEFQKDFYRGNKWKTQTTTGFFVCFALLFHILLILRFYWRYNFIANSFLSFMLNENKRLFFNETWAEFGSHHDACNYFLFF